MNKFAWLAGLLLWILLALWLSNKYICNKNVATGGVVQGMVEDDNYVADGSAAPLGFSRSAYDIDIMGDVSTKFAAVANRLLDNPSESVTITGCYIEDEANDSSFDNLGLARANSIKSWLMDNGVSPDQIKLQSVECDEMERQDDALINGINLDYRQITAKASSSSSSSNSSNYNVASVGSDGSLVLNYRINREKVSLTNAQRSHLEDLIAQNGFLDVVGHTDDEEYDAVALSLSRAARVKKYLVDQMNMDPSKISIYGYGSDRGVAENCSPAGRAKNRRVEIIAR